MALPFSLLSRLTRSRHLPQRRDEKLITIVMPFLNEGEEPRKTIESIYRTTPSPLFKIIAIDDASDEPPKGFDEFDDVCYIRNEHRIGSAGCRHLGAGLVETPYLFIIDAHMRFKQDDWCLKLIDALEKEPQTAFCTTCLGLSEGRMNVYLPKGKYYGATLTIIDETATPDRPARNILEPKWAKKQKQPVYEIPCLLGANYAFSSDWFRTIRGVDGLQIWGTQEPFLSLKTWLAGGKCKIITDIEIGHKFRDHAPYRTPVYHLVYNKIFVCKTVLPDDLGEKLIDYLPKDGTFRRAMKQIKENAAFIEEARRYYRRLFNTSIYDYCRRFDIALPS